MPNIEKPSAETNLCCIIEVHGNEAKDNPNHSQLNVAQEYRRRRVLQQLLKIDSGKTRHHARRTDCRQTNSKALCTPTNSKALFTLTNSNALFTPTNSKALFTPTL